MKREMTIIGSTRKYKSNKLKVKKIFFKKKLFVQMQYVTLGRK